MTGDGRSGGRITAVYTARTRPRTGRIHRCTRAVSTDVHDPCTRPCTRTRLVHDRVHGRVHGLYMAVYRHRSRRHEAAAASHIFLGRRQSYLCDFGAAASHIRPSPSQSYFMWLRRPEIEWTVNFQKN